MSSSAQNSEYIVRNYDGSSTRYLVRRAKGRTYRWAKCATWEAEVLSYDAARKAAQSYGGTKVVIG